MLDCFKCFMLCCGMLLTSFWPQVNADPYVHILSTKDTTDICLNQAHRLEQCANVKQLIILIIQLRDLMISEGYQFPRLTHILEACRDAAIKEGIKIDEAEFEALRAE